MSEIQTPIAGLHLDETVILNVNRLAYQGHAVARRDGLVHFVEGALPGERVQARITRRGARHVFAETLAVLSPSPLRVAPPCPVYESCGGCHLLHAAYSLQIEAKAQFVRDAFRRWPETVAAVREPLAAETPFRFRNRMSYSIGRAEGAPVVGLHARGDTERIVSARHCVLPAEWHGEILERTAALLARHPDAVRDGPRRLDLREGRRTGQRMATLSPPPAPPLLESWLRDCGELVDTVVVSNVFDPRRGAVRCRAVKGRGWIEERLDRWTFEIGPHTFFQTCTEQAEALFRAAAERVAELKPARVIELFAGVGALTAFLSPHADEIVAIERYAPSVSGARRNLRRNRIENVRFLCRDAAAFRPAAGSSRRTCWRSIRPGPDWMPGRGRRSSPGTCGACCIFRAIR